jgi:cytochrome c oxidase subunit 3
MKHRSIIDVSALPRTVLDHRSPIWWGNVLLLAIETTMFSILVASYFYYRVVDFSVWPPPRVNQLPVLYHSTPALLVPAINLALLLLSVLPMAWADKACLKRRAGQVKTALVICVLLGGIVIGLRFVEFKSLQFRWDDNAYASIIWTMAGMHLIHVIIATSELLIMALWLFLKGMDDKHARDVRVTASYWYWVAGIWVVLYLVIYGGPRWL